MRRPACSLVTQLEESLDSSHACSPGAASVRGPGQLVGKLLLFEGRCALIAFLQPGSGACEGFRAAGGRGVADEAVTKLCVCMNLNLNLT